MEQIGFSPYMKDRARSTNTFYEDETASQFIVNDSQNVDDEDIPTDDEEDDSQLAHTPIPTHISLLAT